MWPYVSVALVVGKTGRCTAFYGRFVRSADGELSGLLESHGNLARAVEPLGKPAGR